MNQGHSLISILKDNEPQVYVNGLQLSSSFDLLDLMSMIGNTPVYCPYEHLHFAWKKENKYQLDIYKLS